MTQVVETSRHQQSTSVTMTCSKCGTRRTVRAASQQDCTIILQSEGWELVEGKPICSEQCFCK